jgi:hypothetical protein
MTTVETSDLAITASTEVSAVYRQNQVNEPVLPVPVPLNPSVSVNAAAKNLKGWNLPPKNSSPVSGNGICQP